MSVRRALVLTGGGARGAYQVGVLKFIGEKIPEARFEILVGSSAGAINIGILASESGKLHEGAKRLESVWGNLVITQVLRVDMYSLLKSACTWLFDLILGGFFGRTHARSLIDTTPLRKLLVELYQPATVEKALSSGEIRSLAITATEVSTGSAVTFVQGELNNPWKRSRRRSVLCKIGPEHLYASSAIPFLFSPTLVNKRQYVDGSVRATAPFGPAARLGADRILAIGVRKMETKQVPAESGPAETAEKAPSPSAIGGLVLNSLFFDNLDSDAEHLERINKLLEDFRRVDPEAGAQSAMRPIRVTVVRPSEDLGVVAGKYHSRLPLFLRYLLRGLGSEESRSSDVMSYLLFDKGYTQHLMVTGYRDAAAAEAELRAFFKD